MKIRLVHAALAAVVLLIPAAPAAATSSPAEEVCTMGGLPVAEGEAIPDDIPLVVSCFETVAEAEEFIDAGAPGDLEQLLGDAVHARSSAATVAIGRIWTGTSRSGTLLIQWGAGSGCYGVIYGFPSMSSGWNDVVRSSQGYANCWATHYENTSYGGSSLTCSAYCSSLGSLAAKTSSIVYRPVGTFG